jgi:histidinol-phosphatase (PHP family)
MNNEVAFMMYDTHIHTGFSHDSRMDIKEVLLKIKQLDMGVIITEHIDMNYPDPLAFNLDVASYFKEYSTLRCEQLLLGIEVGMGLEDISANRKLTETHPFDFVLGSIHVVDNADLYEEGFYTGKTKRQVYEQYFEVMFACLNAYDFIDSLGHIDYISRYARFADREVRYDEFAKCIDDILALLVRNQICLEINARRLGDRQAVDSLKPIFKRYYDLGGRYVTIGSDAHIPGDIGKNFTSAFEIAEYCNLKAVWFKERRMEYVK